MEKCVFSMFSQHWSSGPWEEKEDKQQVKDLEKGSSQHSSSCLTQFHQPSSGISSPAAALRPREAAAFGRKSNITASDSFSTKPPPNPPPSPSLFLPLPLPSTSWPPSPTYPVCLLSLDVIHCTNGFKLPWGSVTFMSLNLFGSDYVYWLNFYWFWNTSPINYFLHHLRVSTYIIYEWLQTKSKKHWRTQIIKS